MVDDELHLIALLLFADGLTYPHTKYRSSKSANLQLFEHTLKQLAIFNW